MTMGTSVYDAYTASGIGPMGVLAIIGILITLGVVAYYFFGGESDDI